MDFDGFDLFYVLVVFIFALILGFGIGESSIKKEIGHYGCEAVQKTWKENR